MHVPFNELVNELPVEITGFEVDSASVTFRMFSGRVYRMRYEQDCCASCSIESIDGDVGMLIGYAILQAEEVSNADEPLDSSYAGEEYRESYTWTFYKLATERGHLTIRWYGSSNGYYSESPSFYRIA